MLINGDLVFYKLYFTGLGLVHFILVKNMNDCRSQLLETIVNSSLNLTKPETEE